MNATGTQARVLVIDDEADIRELLTMTLQRMDINSVQAATLKEGRQRLAAGGIDLCLTDMRLPDGDGLELVKEVQQNHPLVPVAVITAHGSMETAIEALKSGAFDFLSKPIDLKTLRSLIRSGLRVSEASKLDPSANLPVELSDQLTMVGQSPAMRETKRMIAKLARSQAPVYISGESGTGKELVARLIHASSPRADEPFVPVNCGAIPGELMESEFFGHRRGSFTGANSDKAGLFQAAEGGTLFLDEVGDLPLHMQVKLLRVIQEKAVRRIGDQKEIPVDVRLLSATHQDLQQAVEQKRFRRDLFYRINVIELPVPSLSERISDLPLLIKHILKQLTGGQSPEVSDEAMRALKHYRFPGNVRELENILERAVTLCDDNILREADLRLPRDTADATNAGNTDELPPADLPAYLEAFERDAINRALERTRFNKTAAARQLGISFRALRYRLKKLGMDDSSNDMEDSPVE